MDLRPSTRALQRAFQLGILMAKQEGRIIPILSGAHQYATYIQFATAHRHRLESLGAFERWETALEQLANAEGKRLNLRSDDPRHWDPFINAIVTPIRCSFWYGWESAFNLRKLYEQQVKLARRETSSPAILRVFNPPSSPLIPSSPLPERFDDDRQWDEIAASMAKEDAERRQLSAGLSDPQRSALWPNH